MMMLKKSSSFNIVAQNVSVAIYAYLMGEKQQRAECVFIQYCAEKTNQQNWKESVELKIAPKTKNQFSCRRGCQNINLACSFLI